MASFATREFGVNCGRGVGRAHGASAAGRGDSKEMERCATTGGCGVICVAVVTFWGVFFERRRLEGDSGDRASERAAGGGGGGGRSRPRDARRLGDFLALFRAAGGGDGGGRSRSRPSDWRRFGGDFFTGVRLLGAGCVGTAARRATATSTTSAPRAASRARRVASF